MNNAPFGSVFGPSATPVTISLGGHGATHLDTDGVRSAVGMAAGAEIFGDDAGFSQDSGSCVVTRGNALVNPELMDTSAEVVVIPGEHADRFDFRDEMNNLLYEPSRAVDTLGRMLLVLLALARGQMTLNSRFVAEGRNNNTAGGINFITYDAEVYLTLYNALMRIYARATNGTGAATVMLPTVLMMRRAGQLWNQNMSFGVSWDYTVRRLLAESNHNNRLRTVKDLAPQAFFDGLTRSTYRRLVALHITTFSCPTFNPSNATYTYTVPSSVSSIGPRQTNLTAQFVSASVLSVLGGRFGGGNVNAN